MYLLYINNTLHASGDGKIIFSHLSFPILYITQCLMAQQMYLTYALTPGRFGLPMPIYVNMVRDPVERVISWYYYVRAPWYFVERKRAFPDLPLPNPNWLRKVNVVTSGFPQNSSLP